MRLRWPWSTREDEVIRLLDKAIREAEKNRKEAKHITEQARVDTVRKLEGER